MFKVANFSEPTQAHFLNVLALRFIYQIPGIITKDADKFL